jgi:hypothetical protein
MLFTLQMKARLIYPSMETYLERNTESAGAELVFQAYTEDWMCENSWSDWLHIIIFGMQTLNVEQAG